MLVVLVATLTGILGLLAGLLATALLLAGLPLAAALLVLAALTALATLLVLTALTRILRVLILWILAHRYSLQLPQPQFNRWQNKQGRNIDPKNLG
jgi:ABC-type bacteriocin/lantibiotic exporter with double-glycine peptidase domain